MSNPTNPIRAGAIALVALTLGLTSAEAARAGTYVMRSCNVPGYASAPLGPWQAAPSANAAVIDTCMSGGSASVSFAGAPHMAHHTRASLTLVRPTQGPHARISLAGMRIWGVARLSGSGGPLDVQAMALGPNGVTATQGSSIGLAAAWELAAPEMPLDPATTTAVQVALVCNDPPDRPASPRTLGAEDCYPVNHTPLEVQGIEVRLEENTAPAAAIEGGTALASGPQAGERTLQFSAKDLESGVEKVEAVVGDTVVASRDLSAQCPHTGFSACPASDSGVLTLDTRAVANGTHKLALRVTDAAGNAQIVPAAAPIEIANAAAPTAPGPSSSGLPSSGLPSSGPPTPQGRARLTARFSSSSRSAVVVSFGRAVTVSGRLAFGSARPPATTSIAVAERTATAGARERIVGTVLTRGDGTFSYRLSTSGPSRSIRFVYGSVASKTLSLRIRAAARFAVALHGTTLSYRGRVVSGPIPSRGKRIQLWGRAPGFAWTRFLRVVTDRHGRFAGRFRLRAHRPGVRLQIELRIPQEQGYPYLRYRSSPRALKVS